MHFMLKPLAVIVSLALSGPVLADCSGNVVIGEGAAQITSQVSNKTIGASCLNDLIIDTAAEGANYGNHGEFVVYLTRLQAGCGKNPGNTPPQAPQPGGGGARFECG